MKKKLVVKTLALLLTSVMVMETPMQSFAANADTASIAEDVQSEDVQSEDGSDTPDGNTVDGSAADNSQNTEQIEDQNGSEDAGNDQADVAGTDDASDSADNDAPSGDNTGENADETTAGKEGNADSGDQDAADENTDADSNQGEQVDIKTLEAQDPEKGLAVVAEETKELPIKASQFGDQPDDYTGAETYTGYNAIETALKNKTENVDLTGNTCENETQLKAIIIAVLEKNEIKLLPMIKYDTETNGHINKVYFSYGDDSLKIDALEWKDNSVDLKYTFSSTTKKVEVYRGAKSEEGKIEGDKKLVETFTPNSSNTEFVDSESVPGDYAYILYGYDDNGNLITYSNIMSCDYTLPDVTGLKVSAVDRTGTTISWNKLDVADGYVVSRKERDANDDTYQVLTEIKKNDTVSFKDEKTAVDKFYTYKVTAYRKRTESENWESKTPATVDGIAGVASLAEPTVDFMSPSSDQATLTWKTVPGAEGYEVYTYANGKCDYSSAKEVKDTKYQLTGLQAGQIYQYVVCPYKTVEGFRVYGALSDVVDVETKLGNSTIQAVVAAYNQIKVNWAQTAQADGYELYRNDQLYKTVNGISNCYLVDTVACGTTYNYKVRPFRNANGKKVYGEFSSQASAVTSLPATSMNKVTAVDYKTLDVSWNQGTGATGYELYRSTSSNTGFALVKDITSGNTLTYRDNGLNIGTTYYYKVKAYRTENGKKVYAPETGVIFGTVNLGVVTGLQAKSTAYNRIEITWNKMSAATGYELYYSTSPDGNYKFLKKLGKNSVKFKWSRAQCGVTYYFQIRPIQKVKRVVNYGSFSESASAMAVIGTPTDLKVRKVTYNTVTLKWKGVKGAKRYNIYYSDSANGTYQSLLSVRGRSTQIKNLETGKTYYFKITAVRDSFESTMTGAVSATPSMGNLTSLKAESVSSSELQISWKGLRGIDKYVILRSTSASGTYTQVGTTTKAFYTDKNLSSATTYYYKVYGMRGNYKTNECGPVNARTKDQGSINTNEDKKSIYKGIDVSQWQGTIDWDAVADDGIDFAMIRILRGKDFSDVHYDTQFKNNYKGARAAGLYVGVYSYSYATTRTQARKEAKAVVEALDGKKLDYPVVMDYEDSSILQGTSTNVRRAEIILAYKKVIEDAGYKFALYANKNWLDNYIDTGMLGDTHIWIARWRSLSSGHGYNGSGKVTMWQYTDKGSVKGISGKVDMDVSYKKYR